jgi:hypothetical protein
LWNNYDGRYIVQKQNLEQPFNDSVVGSPSTIFGHDFYSHKRVLRAKFPQPSTAENPDIYAIIDMTTLTESAVNDASSALNAWFTQYIQQGNTGRLFVIPTYAQGDLIISPPSSSIGIFEVGGTITAGTGQERWLAIPEMIKLGILDVTDFGIQGSFLFNPYLIQPNGLGGTTTINLNTGALSTAAAGYYTSPDDLILISFFDESGPAYHGTPVISNFNSFAPYGPNDIGPGVGIGVATQPFDAYIRDFEYFVGTYSPLTGNPGTKFNSFKGILYPIVRGGSFETGGGGSETQYQISGLRAAFAMSVLAAWAGTTLSQSQIDGLQEFGNQLILGISTDDTVGYPGDPFSSITDNSTSGWDDGWEKINVDPILTVNPYDTLIDSNGEPGLWHHGWIVALDKRFYNTNNTPRNVFEISTFTQDLNSLLGINVVGLPDPFVATFPAGSIIFVEEAFLTTNSDLTFTYSSMNGLVSFGLQKATSDGLNGDVIPTLPPMSTFGLTDTYEIFFPLRDTSNLELYQGYTLVSDSPVSVIKISEPAQARLNLTNDLLLYDGEITLHIPYIVDNPGLNWPKPQGPTAYPSARPFISGGGAAQPIDYQEVAWGTGTGITSSDIFKFYCDSANLLVATSSCISSDSLRSGIIGGRLHTLTASRDTIILGGTGSAIFGSTGSSIIGGNNNLIIATQGSNRANAIIASGDAKIYSCSSYSAIIATYFNSRIEKSKNSAILGGGGSLIYGAGNNLRNVILGGSSTRIYKGIDSSIVSSRASRIDCSNSSVITAGCCLRICETIDSTITGGCYHKLFSSTQSSILGGFTNSIYNSRTSIITGGFCNYITGSSAASIIGGATNSICNSINSAIIGGFGLTLSSENNVVYVPTLKLNLATQSIDSLKVLTWDGDNYVRYVDTSTLAGQSQPIDYQEVAWGTGTGITSSDIFKWYCEPANLLISTGSCVSSDSLRSAVIGGWTLSITASNDSLILGGIMQSMATSSYSSILGGSCNCINNSYASGIMSSSKGVIIGSSNGCSIYNTIISSCRVCICSYGAQEPKYSSIISSVNVTIDRQSFNNSVISSAGSAKITKTSLSMLIASTGGLICNSIRSALIGGCSNCNNITYGVSIISSRSSQIISNSAAGATLTRRICYSSIIGGGYNCICNFTRNSIITSGCKNIVWGKETYVNGTTFSTPGMSIIGSRNSTIFNSDYSSIISSTVSGITGSYTSTIIGSVISKITGSTVSSIISSSQSLIENSERSSIIGGYGMTLSSENDVVYLPTLKLNLATQSVENARILTWDNDNYVRYTTSLSTPMALPVPKIHLNNGTQSIDVWDPSINGIHATQAQLYGWPTLINMDFTSDHFINPNNRIFIEMAIVKRKSNTKKALQNNRQIGSKWVVPSKHIAGVGQDTSLPWLTSGGHWSRGGSHSVLISNDPLPGYTHQILGIDRPNHYEVYGYTISSYPIWQYFTGRFQYYQVGYRDSATFNPGSPALESIETLIPISGKRRGGKFSEISSNRFAYSSMYTPLYCAFRYIQWLPLANGGKGQIVSGPFSKTLKVVGYFHPFQVDYLASAQLGYPVASISQNWLNGKLNIGVPAGPGYNLLKVNWGSNLP